MRDDQKGDPDPFLDADQFEPGLGPQLAVERRQWLVEQQQFGHFCQRPRQCDALALTTGQFVRAAPLVASHLHQCQHLLDPGGNLPAFQPLLTQSECDIARDIHMREQRIGLEHHIHRPLIRRQPGDIDPVNDDAAAVGYLETGNHAQQGRLAAPRRPEQRVKGAPLDAQRYIIDCCGRTEPLRDACDFEQRHSTVLDQRPCVLRDGRFAVSSG